MLLAYGDKIKYLYDTLDRVAEIQYNNGSNGAFVTVYTYEYDAAGNVHAVHDHTSGEVTVYKYDAENKLVHTYVYDSDTYVNLHGTTITYDDESRVSSISHSYDYTVSSGVVNEQIVYEYGYSQTNGSIHSHAATSEDNSYYAELTYDNLGRRTERIQGVIVNNANTYFARTSYTYKTNGNSQSDFVASYTTTVTRDHSSSALYTSTYTFTYDANGNITQVSDASGVLYKYTYDDLGQLVREDNRALGKSYTFTYDNAGNIKEKKTYAYNTDALGTAIETVSYTYEDSEWKDLLTKYGNTNITYDTIGNPITIGTATLTWQGRQLMSYTDNGTTISYTYNADGIRTSKTITEGSTTTKHEYVLRGGEILQETVYVNNVEQYTVIYIYDENGSPLGMKYRTPSYAADTFDVYVFEKSLQGDIIAIYDDTTAKVVTYTYDAWGNITMSGAKASTIGVINPFRYRGYYYDNETNLYYLQSRYYNSNWGRFLNMDGFAFLGANRDLNSFNMYTYCSNNPIMLSDPSGHIVISAIVIGVVIGAAIGFGGTAYVDYAEDGELFDGSVSAKGYVINTLMGGATGGFVAAAAPVAAEFLTSYVVPTVVSASSSTAVAVAGAQIVEVTIIGACLVYSTTSKSGGYWGQKYSDDHAPDHIHLKGTDGTDVRIGKDGKPLDSKETLKPQQRKALKRLWNEILELFAE